MSRAISVRSKVLQGLKGIASFWAGIHVNGIYPVERVQEPSLSSLEFRKESFHDICDIRVHSCSIEQAWFCSGVGSAHSEQTVPFPKEALG